jgi:hypothetical protein
MVYGNDSKGDAKEVYRYNTGQPFDPEYSQFSIYVSIDG